MRAFIINDRNLISFIADPSESGSPCVHFTPVALGDRVERARERFYETSSSVDATRLRGAMQRRENGALIERMGSAGIELHINSDRGPRERSGRVVTFASDRAEDDPVSRDLALVAAPRARHVDRIAIHARSRCAVPRQFAAVIWLVRGYGPNTNATTATTTSKSKIP